MPIVHSPLRYPGGKSVLADFLAGVLQANNLLDGIYAEPYAGGAGAALALLFSEYVQKIIINDADPCIFAFWDTILNDKNTFIKLIEATPVTLDVWNTQRGIYRNYSNFSKTEVAFATFFLNRCNRSGIIVNGGPIGGNKQDGKWKIDARFNKKELIRRIEKIYLYKDRISTFNLDAIDFIEDIVLREDIRGSAFVYLDPPYYVKGNQLYLNHYIHEDHAKLANFIKPQNGFKWIISYDNVEQIRHLYKENNIIDFDLSYSAHTRKSGKEILIHKSNLNIPLQNIS